MVAVLKGRARLSIVLCVGMAAGCSLEGDKARRFERGREKRLVPYRRHPVFRHVVPDSVGPL